MIGLPPAARWPALVGWILVAACTGDEPASPPETDAGALSTIAPSVVAARLAHAADDGDGAPEVDRQDLDPPTGADGQGPEGPEPTLPTAETHPFHGIAFHFLAHVFAEPSLESPIVGYLRRGSRFRASEPVEGDDCKGGWHRLAGDGFVCPARGFLLGTSPRSFEPSPVPPALEDALPYAYARVTGARVPQYWRVPTPDEERATTHWIERASPATPVARPGQDAGARDGGGDAAVPQGDGEPSRPDVVRLLMKRNFFVSLDEQAVDGEDDDDSAFVRTVRGTYVPKETLAPVTPPPGRGVALGTGHALPVAFVHRDGVTRFRIDPSNGRMVPIGPTASGAAFDVRATRVHQGRPFVVARDGTLVRETAVRVARLRERPRRVPEGARWLHVSLPEQTLVAYEGDRPVFATLVSSGRSGFETPTGLYRVFSKHITATMDDLASEEPFLIEDVPWVMYFERSFALHGAFWHSGFGRVRSHGCVNLAPADAHWIFRWSGPTLPPAWHGVEARGGRQGIHVLIED
jgi:hypothetical protein